MDDDALIDLKIKVKYRLPEYLEKAKLPLDKSDPENLKTICPCCSGYAKVLYLPLDPPQYLWSCPECGAEGDAVKYAKEYFGMETERQAIVDVCRKLGIRISILSTITAEELIKKDFDPLQELIQGMLAPGLYILAGASKIGKSWLVLQIAHHISMGIPLWNRTTIKSDVLYLSLEDTERRIRHVCSGSVTEKPAILPLQPTQRFLEMALNSRLLAI